MTDSETPLLSRGGVAARQRKSCEATLARADGVVLIKRMILLTSLDQYGATLGSWFGVPDANLATIFPSLADFAPQNLGFF